MTLEEAKKIRFCNGRGYSTIEFIQALQLTEEIKNNNTMTEENKQLLLKDLCGRIPYGVICHYNCVIPIEGRELHKANCKDVLKGIIPTSDGHIGFMVGFDRVNALEGDIKPYLRPMSSMTEEEKKEFQACHCVYELHPDFQPMMCNLANELNMFDWLNKHHFDYRGLIEKGLALEANEGYV